jgi:NAD(P)H-dependent FMN reductase
MQRLLASFYFELFLFYLLLLSGKRTKAIMYSIVTLVTDSVSSASTTALTEFVHRITRRAGINTSSIVLRNLRSASQPSARQESHAVESARALLEQADGVIVVMPAGRTAGPEMRKAYADLFTHNVFRAKSVLPVVTGVSSDYPTSLDHFLKPLLAEFGACNILRSLPVTETGIRLEHGGLVRLDDQVEYGLRKALGDLITGIRQAEAV